MLQVSELLAGFIFERTFDPKSSPKRTAPSRIRGVQSLKLSRLLGFLGNLNSQALLTVF